MAVIHHSATLYSLRAAKGQTIVETEQVVVELVSQGGQLHTEYLML